MTMGVVMPATFPNVLNKAPLKPAISFGEVSDTTAQPKAPMPFPKKAKHMITTTRVGEST